MYVVRILAGETCDYKAYEHLPDAKSRFNAGWRQTDDGEFDSIAIFEVENPRDVREAVAAVRECPNGKVRLLELKESAATEIAKLASKIDLSDLGL